MTTEAERAAHAHWKRRRARLIGYGQWKPFADAEPVRAHVKTIMDTNMPMYRISERTGVEKSTLKRLMNGSHGYPPTKKIRTESAEKLLAYRPTLDDYPDDTSIDATGSRRRIQALATRGWTGSHIAARLEVSQQRIKRVTCRPAVSAATARLVRDIYNDLWDKQPTEEEVPRWLAERAQTIARTACWASPLAWDEDTIDDPKAKPRLGRTRERGTAIDEAAVIRAVSGERLPLTAMERTAAVEYGIRRRHMDYDTLADALGMDHAAVKRSWERIKERARKRGETWPNSPQWTVAA